MEPDPISEKKIAVRVRLKVKEYNECNVIVAAHYFSHNDFVLHLGGAQRSTVGQLVPELSYMDIGLMKIASEMEHRRRYLFLPYRQREIFQSVEGDRIR